jgi:hypothetical protein
MVHEAGSAFVMMVMNRVGELTRTQVLSKTR